MQPNRSLSIVGRGLAASVLAATLVTSGVPSIAFAATSSELQAQLEQAQSESASYEEQTAQAFAEFEACQAELEATNASISSIEEEISQKQVELEQAQETLSDRISSNYKTGGASLIEIILGSTSPSDFVSRIYYANKVAASDAEAIQDVRDIQAELDEKQASLQETQAEQTQLVSDAADKASAVQQAQSEHEAYVASLSSEVQQALAEEEAARKAEEERQAAEAAEKAAAELAAREAAEAAEAAEDEDTPAQTNTDSDQTNTSSGQTSGSTSTGSSNTDTSVDYGSGISAVIAAAKSQLGVSYSWSGNAIANTEFDCSGLVWWAYRQAGYSIPRGQRMANGRSNSMIGWCLDNGGWTTDQSQLQAGDLLFWGSSVNSTDHVGLCIGGGMMIHSTYSGVEITSVYYSSGRFVGGGPIV